MTAPPPRQVTVLIDSLLGGGAERVAVETAATLDSTRYVAHLLVTRHSGPLEPLVRELRLPYTILGRRRGFHPAAFLRARRIIRAGDLLHSHKFAGSMWGALLARSARRPLVAHEHTFDGRPSRSRTLGYRYLIGTTARRILCVSKPVAASLVAEGVRPELLEVVPNGVPFADQLDREAARAELGLAPADTVIGMVGRLRVEKRHDLALEALAQLRAEGLEATLCCVGDGPLLEELRALAERLRIADNVLWVGERPSAGRLVRAFDAGLLCSDYEGMPLAALEVLVAGVPLVATAVGSLPELVADGGGRVVPPGDAAALATALRQVLSERDDAERARALERARAQFGLDRVVGDLQRVYDEVLT